MKKIVSIILILIMCTAAVSAAVPEEMGGRKLYTIANIGKSNVDAGSIDKVFYPEQNTDNFALVLKYPDNPDASGDYCVKHMCVSADKQTRLMTPNVSKYTNSVWVATVDLMVEGPELKKAGAAFKLDNEWLGLSYAVLPNGTVTFGGNGNEHQVYEGFKPDNWYNITFIIDTINDKVSTAIKDLESDEPEVVSDLYDFYKKNETEPYDIGYVSYMQVSPSTSSDYSRVIYTDNAENVIMAYAPAVGEVYGADAEGNKIDDGIDFKKPNIVVEVEEALNPSTIKPDSIKLMLGDKEIPQTFTYDEESSSFFITPGEVLLPNTEYTVTISEDVKSNNALSFETLSYPVRTMREYYSVAGVETSTVTAGSEFTVSVTLNNKDNIESTDTLIAAAYDEDGALCSVNAVEVTNPENKAVVPVKLKAPTTHTVSKIDVLFIKSLTAQNFIDVYSITLPTE